MTIKVYVNLPRDPDENHGNWFDLEVEADSLSGEDVARAEWWVEPSGGNNQDEKYLSNAQRARLRFPVTRNRNDRFRNRLRLPHVGGDKYVAKCAKRGDRSDFVELEEVETWRKLYYTVHYMNNDCQNFFNALKAKFENAFKEGFVELELKDSIATLVDEPHTRSTNSLTHLYRTTPRLADRPFHLRLVVLNNIYDMETHTYRLTTADPGVADAAGIVTINTDTPMVPNGRGIRAVRARRAGTRTWISMTRHAQETGEQTITVDLTAQRTINRHFQAGRDIELRVRTRERDDYLGHSIGNFCCVRINESGTPEQRRTTVLQTLTHEVGHGCQQVIRRERLHNANGIANGWENNANWHTDNFGGQGPHCSLNARLRASTRTTSGQEYTHNSGTLCTMFYRDDPAVDADGKFCAQCKPRLMRVNLGRREMRRQGWGRY